MKATILTTALVVCTFGATAWADTVVMRDGSRYTGRFVSGTGSTITFQEDRGMQRHFNVRDIQSLEFNADRNLSRNNRSYDQSGTAANASNTVMDAPTIPAGTDLVIRTNDAIDSTSGNEGKVYTGTVDREVTDSAGNVVVPRGSNAELVVRDASRGGTTGSADLILDVQSLEVNGQRYMVSTQDLTQSNNSGLGRNRRTAEMVGGGAVLGTLLGAVAGGGKGAAIGAVAGAAAGAGAQVLTRGKEVKVPPETVLTFHLDQPVRLQSANR